MSDYQRYVSRRVKAGANESVVFSREQVLEAFAMHRGVWKRQDKQASRLAALVAVLDAADWGNLRNAHVSCAEVAAAAGFCVKTAKRALADLRAAGFLLITAAPIYNARTGYKEKTIYQVLVPAAYRESITRGEQNATGEEPAQRMNASRRGSISRNVPQPRRGLTPRGNSRFRDGLNTGPLHGQVRGDLQSVLQRTQSVDRGRRRPAKPLPRIEYEFARALRGHLFWLRSASIYQVAAVLRRRHIDAQRWRSAPQLIETINRESAQLPQGHYRIPDAPRSPLGVLDRLLIFAGPTAAEKTPYERQLEAQQRQAAQRAQAAQERAERAVQASTEDLDEIARTKAASDAEIARRNREREIRAGRTDERAACARRELDQLRVNLNLDRHGRPLITPESR